VPLETAPCCPCAIDIDKQVAPDDNCDGTADGAFSDLEQQQFDQCVVYRICVTNTSGTGAGVNDRPQVIEDVFVDDTHLGIDDADFGNLDPGQEECRLVPSEAPATECPGPSGDANDDTCVCEDVVGENTAVVDQALCAVDASDPCTDQPPSDCSDTAEVECITPCSVTIDKKVAADANCDGVEEGAFSDFVQMPIDQCVVYRICVKNTGDQNLNGTGVLVSDAHLNITDLNFGTIAPDAEVCKDVPGDASVGDCAGGTCVCRTVEGPNTATITSAICEDNQANACQQVGSVCEDPAEVDCIDTPCTLDHFKCYKTRTDGSFVPRDVTLADQFESTSALVEKPVRFCNPANKNNEGINDPTAHLMCYDINQATPFQPRHVLVNNQFGEQELVVTKPYQLCNPATKDGVGNFEELDLDHMKCYRVRRAVGSPRVNPTITVQDQFETRTAQVFRPHILCNPVSKNNSGIRNDECHLVCYRLRASLPIFRSQPITVEDQFSSQSLDALRGVCGSVDYVCLPSSKTELD
jgi:hypothetical protein